MLKPSRAANQDPASEVYVGGMRDPFKVVSARPAMQTIGLRIRAAWEALVRKMPSATLVAESYGTKDCKFPHKVIDEWKASLRRVLGAAAPKAVRIKGKNVYTSPLDPELIEAWTNKSEDPESEVHRWVQDGAPLGIEVPIETCGIFPENRGESTGEGRGAMELSDAFTQMWDATNYSSVADDETNARIELDRYYDQGYLKKISAEEVEQNMGHGTISKLGLIVKEKPSGEIKRRIIIDLKRSGGNDKATLPEKIILPRPKDAVDMMRDMYEKRQPYGSNTTYARELVVIDISDAFMALGVHPKEHPHTLAPSLDQEEFYLFAALLFGYKTAPLLWSRVAALWARMSQSFFRGHEAQHQVYLDDGLWMLQGELEERNSNLALILTTAAALGLKVALNKGERGPQTQWIGIKFALVDDFVITTIPEKYVTELIAKLKSWDNKGLAPLRELRQVAGKISWMSGLLPRTRWVVSVFYKVLHTRVNDIQDGTEDRRREAREDKRSKSNFFNVSQLDQARAWLIAYLEMAMLRPSRKLRLDVNKYPKASIITDASPEGLGAILLINNRAVRIMASRVGPQDSHELKFALGEASSQGVVETLAVLVALRLWERDLQSCQVTMVLESDSVIALATSQRYSSSDPALNFLGAEISIACEMAGIEAIQARHIPGSANVNADYLSRPSKWASTPRPTEIKDLPLSPAPEREASFYRLPTPRAKPDLWASNVAASNAWASLK